MKRRSFFHALRAFSSSVRVRLTLWYLVIIACIIGLFGGSLYATQTFLNAKAAESRLETQLYQDAQRRVKLYENQYLLASKSLDLILKSFSTSSSALTDVLRVRQQTLEYELKQVEALADFNTSIAWLKRLMAFSQIQ